MAPKEHELIIQFIPKTTTTTITAATAIKIETGCKEKICMEASSELSVFLCGLICYSAGSLCLSNPHKYMMGVEKKYPKMQLVLTGKGQQ